VPTSTQWSDEVGPRPTYPLREPTPAIPADEPILPPALRGRGSATALAPAGAAGSAAGAGGPVRVRTRIPGGVDTSRTAARPRGRRSGERGLPAWAALAVLIVVAGAAGLIDLARGPGAQGVFNVGVIVASFVAIVVVRRHSMFAIVVAPPIVFMLGKLAASTLRHQDLFSRHTRLDIMTNWFVFGFPAIAAATAVVALVAGLRLIIGK
jgi:hypothetical protein